MQIVLTSTGVIPLPPIHGGAIEASVCDMALALVRRGHDVTLISDVRGPEAAPGCHVVPVNSGLDLYLEPALIRSYRHVIGGNKTAIATKSLLRSMTQGGPVLLHMNEEYSASVVMPHLPSNVRGVFTLHDPPPGLGGRTYGRVEQFLRTVGSELVRRRVAPHVKTLITLNSYSRNYVIDRWSLNPNRVSVLPLPIDTDLYVPRDPFEPPRELRVIFVGRLDRRKNVMMLLEAMSRLPENSTLKIIGDGPVRDEIERFVERASLTKRVALLGRVSNEALLQAYRSSDVLVLPSLLETYGRVLIEAAACGLTTVVPNTPVYHEFLTAGISVGFEPYTASGMEATLRSLQGRPDEFRDRALRGRTYAIRTCGYDRFAERLESIYAQSLS